MYKLKNDNSNSFQPGCMYRVRVKTGESNPLLERASPSFIDIQVNELKSLSFPLHCRTAQFT